MVNINANTPNEYVAEVQWQIWTVPQCCQGILTTLPFSYFPQQITINLVQFSVMWLNALPNLSGISRKWSTRKLICCHKLDNDKHCKVPVRAYCEVHDEHQPTNQCPQEHNQPLQWDLAVTCKDHIKSLHCHQGRKSNDGHSPNCPCHNLLLIKLTRLEKKNMISRESRYQTKLPIY